MGAELSALQRIVPETAPRSLHNEGSRYGSIQFANPLLRSSIGVNKPDGRDEREAEAIAADVIDSLRNPGRASGIGPAGSGPPSSRAHEGCACGGHSAGTPCAQCAKKMVIQRSPDNGPMQASSSANVEQVVHSPGQPLDAATRVLMERRFGHDFSQVRIHTDDHSMESARLLGARAYTLGSHIVFGKEKYAPSGLQGQKLIAHELTHVVQQTQNSSTGMIQRDPDFTLPQLHDFQLTPPQVGHYAGWRQRLLPPPPRLNLNILYGSPQRIDLNLLDQELAKGGPLTQTQGEIGYGSLWCKGKTGSRSCEADPAAQDSQLPLQLSVYPRKPSAPSSTTGTTSSLAPRALVVGGIHGDEGGEKNHALIAERLKKELDAGLSRDFDTLLIPVMNPGGMADNKRTNRHGVDLNRNFPGLPGFPTGSPVVEQPETEAVKKVVQTLRPSRILVLHAHGEASKGGVYADPVEGEARELACRMAVKMKAASTGNEVVPGNQLDEKVCKSRYPDSAAVSVSTTQSSLGAWGSAPKSAGGGGAVVITHEIPDKDNLKNPLPEHGAGRSVDSMMPGIRDFLLDNRRAPSEADALLTKAVTRTFLSGQDTPDDVKLRDAISAIVKRRFDDMNAFYKGVWRGSQPAAISATLPAALSIVASTGVRDFARQAGIVNTELAKTLTATSNESDIEKAILKVMETRSMPGFSRHHWGTDMDLVSAERTDWDPSKGRFRALIPFLQEHAFRFGFFHPYTAGYSRSAGTPAQAGFPTPAALHYLEEPWHVSYWPIANVLKSLWLQTFSGKVLDNLIAETAHAVHGAVPEDKMAKVLTKIGLTSFQSNVAPSP